VSCRVRSHTPVMSLNAAQQMTEGFMLDRQHDPTGPA